MLQQDRSLEDPAAISSPSVEIKEVKMAEPQDRSRLQLPRGIQLSRRHFVSDSEKVREKNFYCVKPPGFGDSLLPLHSLA